MKLYPAIDLKDGKCVRLLQGDYNEVTIYGSQPEEMAKKWELEGGDALHIVDLDGAKAGKGVNEQAIQEITSAVHIPIELGGGIRTLEDIKRQLDRGISRVILGSVAVKNQSLVKEAITLFGPKKVVVGVDAKEGKVAVEGWLQVTDTSALTFCKELEKIGVETVIYTDIAKDGMMQGPNLAETQRIIEETNLQVVASGGIASLKDLEDLKAIGAYGVIIGKAIYTGAIKLEEAARLLRK